MRIKKFSALVSAAAFCLGIIPQTADASDLEFIPETKEAFVLINADKGHTEISPYIYGVNDSVYSGGTGPTVLKQDGTALSSYNWETNYSNNGKDGYYSNDVALIDGYPSALWNSPALHADTLMKRAAEYDIPVKLITLQMMGYVAADSMGIVSPMEATRWLEVRNKKGEAYLSHPDTEDDYVYMDEYVSYLVNKYGTASEGGINGYFLGREPDRWDENYEVLGLDSVTADELISRSAELAEVVKTIDSRAFIFGPSLSGLQGCIDLGNNSDRASSGIYNKEYSWFIDYYLSEMRRAGERDGRRLLDVLDVHYYTEALTPVGIPVLTSDDEISNAYRMQAVRTLWDSDYTENSPTALMNKQFTPIIPTLQAAIRINYPGTRLSFSEYDFGGGNNISGAVAEAEVLGTFASEEVYLACLSSKTGDTGYQEAALKLYTDYDGEGSGFGNTLVSSDNGGDTMSAVFAATDSKDTSSLKIVLTSRNVIKSKDFYVDIKSKKYDYTVTGVYYIDHESPSVVKAEDMPDISDNSFSFEAEPASVYLIELSGTSSQPNYWVSETSVSDEEPDVTDVQDSEIVSEVSQISEEPSVSEETTVITTTENPAYQTQPDLTGGTETISETVVSHTETEESVSETESVTEQTYLTDDNDSDRGKVILPVKILVSVLVLAVGAGLVYILLFDKR